MQRTPLRKVCVCGGHLPRKEAADSECRVCRQEEDRVGLLLGEGVQALPQLMRCLPLCLGDTPLELSQQYRRQLRGLTEALTYTRCASDGNRVICCSSSCRRLSGTARVRVSSPSCAVQYPSSP
jgi:hypothetical protein